MDWEVRPAHPLVTVPWPLCDEDFAKIEGVTTKPSASTETSTDDDEQTGAPKSLKDLAPVLRKLGVEQTLDPQTLRKDLHAASTSSAARGTGGDERTARAGTDGGGIKHNGLCTTVLVSLAQSVSHIRVAHTNHTTNGGIVWVDHPPTQSPRWSCGCGPCCVHA